MNNVPPFLDFLAAHTAQRIPLRSDAAVSSMVHQIEDRALRLRGTMPLVFCAAEAGWPGFGVATAVEPRDATMAVTIRDGVIAADGLGWTARATDAMWPRGERLVLVYAGGDYGAVLVSRAAAAAATSAPRSYAYWSYDSTVARLACIWVGAYLARPHVDTALRWNAGVNAMGDHSDGELRRLLRRKRIERARNARADGGAHAEDAPGTPRLGDDVRRHGQVRGQPPWGW